jgi:serine/threonine protein kinase
VTSILFRGRYLAPEYFMHGKVSDKLDVYAFGVVLLELISGRKPVSAGGPRAKGSLVMWASSVIQGGKLMDLVDPSLPLADGDAGEVERMALAAALCIRRVHQHRPSMSNVTTSHHCLNEPNICCIAHCSIYL